MAAGQGRRRVSVVAGVTDFWRKYVGLNGECLDIDTFGESAPAEVLYEHFHLTVDGGESVVGNALAKRAGGEDCDA